MAKKVRLKGLLAKIESTYKTDSSPVAGADGIQIEEDIWGSIEVGHLEENLREQLAQKGFGRAGSAAPSGPWGHITASVAVKGAGAQYQADGSVVAELDVLLRMAGHQVTWALDSGTYTPRSSGFESATVYAYSSGQLFKLVGCRAILSRWSIIPGQISRMVFDIWGVMPDVPTDVSLPTITYPRKDVTPPAVTSAGLTLNSFDPDDFSSFEFRQGLELPARRGGNDSDGHPGYDPVDWNPEFTAVIQAPTLASFDPYTLRKDGTLFAWDIQVGGTQYNQAKLSGTKARIVDVPHSESDGFAMTEIRARCQNTDEETPDTAYSIVFD